MTDSVGAVCNTAVEAIRTILATLPDEAALKAVLERVLEHRCPKCFDYSADNSFWCCYDSRGD